MESGPGSSPGGVFGEHGARLSSERPGFESRWRCFASTVLGSHPGDPGSSPSAVFRELRAHSHPCDPGSSPRCSALIRATRVRFPGSESLASTLLGSHLGDPGASPRCSAAIRATRVRVPVVVFCGHGTWHSSERPGFGPRWCTFSERDARLSSERPGFESQWRFLRAWCSAFIRATRFRVPVAVSGEHGTWLSSGRPRWLCFARCSVLIRATWGRVPVAEAFANAELGFHPSDPGSSPGGGLSRAWGSALLANTALGCRPSDPGSSPGGVFFASMVLCSRPSDRGSSPGGGSSCQHGVLVWWTG